MESLVLVWLRRVAWLVPPIIVGLLAYTIATVLREPMRKRQIIALVAFGVTLLIILVILLVKWLRRRRKAGKLEDGLLGGKAGSADRRAEIDALRKTWRQSVAALKTSGAGGGGKRALAVLPWYVIIGAPASGKSTLLRQSGIDFPVGDAAIRGLQGTRNCDWWFSNIGIFLDTAGRYMSDESAAEWGQFLDLVRKHRTEAPIQGVIVALPASDLVSKNATDLDADARRIRARLDELIDHLGINFPVWVVLTKVDLVGGFAEMFSHADAQTRRQMVGWTAEIDEGARFDGAKFETRFRSLVDRLRDVRPVLVGQAPLRERAPAYAFADEFAALGEPLGAMLRRMFEPNVYQETPLFRGLFVTSATQQGTPLQKAAARVRELLGVASAPPASETVISHAYFVQDLVHERIVPDRHMTWTTRMEIDRGKTKRIGINLTLASAAVFLFFCVIAFGSKAANELDDVEKHFDAATAETTGGVERAAALWNAAEGTSDDNYKNLGLSSQRNLKYDLLASERETFRTEVIVGAGRALEAEIAETQLDPGPGPLVDAWKACRDVREAMVRAIVAGREAPGDQPTAEFVLSDTEKKSFLRLRPRLAKEKVVAAQGGAYPAELVECLLRRRKDEDPDKDRDLAKQIDASLAALGALDVSFAKRAADYVARAAAAVTDVEQNETAWKRYLDDRLARFKKTCESEADQLERGGVSDADLDATLKQLVDAAAGGTSKPTAADPKQTADAEQQSLVMSIGSAVPALKGLAKSSPKIDAVMSGEAWAKLESWTGATPTGPAPPPPGVRESPIRKALEEIVQRLRELADRAGRNELVPDQWPEKFKSVREGVAAIDKEVNARDKEWRAGLDPSLAALGSVPAPPAPSPWRAVLAIDPILRRNAMLRTFVALRRRGGYADLAKEVLKARQQEEAYDRENLLRDLDELIEIVPEASEDLRKLVTTDVLASASKEVVAQFQAIVDAAREHWKSRGDELPKYGGGDPWAYLKKWTTTEGAVAGLAAEFSKKFGGVWAAPSGPGYTGPRQNTARDAWKAAEQLRQSYRFYWGEFGALREALSALVLLKDWTPDQRGKAGLEDLGKALKSEGNKPVWDAKTLVESLDASVTGEGLRNSLEKAVTAAESWLLTRVVDEFNTRWSALKTEIGVAFAGGDPATIDDVIRKLDALARDLAALFGDGLNETPGGRLAVSAPFRQALAAVRRYSAARRAVIKGFTIDLRCDSVPYRKEGVGDAGYPYLEIVYSEVAPPHEEKRFCAPRAGDQLTLRWTPERGAKLQINLWDQQKTASKPFKKWLGRECLLDAIREGGGGERLTWAGEGEFAGWTPAIFIAQPDDPQLLATLLSRATTDPTGEVAQAATCVERPGGR